MSVTTSKRINRDRLISQLPGVALTIVGAELEDAAQKTITAEGFADPQLTAAVDAAAAAFVDYDNNRAVLAAKAVAALTSNATFLALPDPTTGNTTYLAIGNPNNAQVVAQVRALTQQSNAYAAQLIALTKQMDVLIRLAANRLDSAAGT